MLQLPKRRGRRFALLALGVFFVGAGVNHFLSPDFYVAMMPPYLPWHDGLIYLAGGAEIGLGLAVLIPQVRRVAAWGIILLLVAIFPANIHIALYNVPLAGAQEGAGILNWVRLPFQLVLIAWAWWFTRPDGPTATPIVRVR